MQLDEFTLRLSLVAVLAVYLYWKHWQWERQRHQREAQRAQWAGTPIDAAKLMPRVQWVRQHYASESHVSRSHIWYRRGLLALARKTFARLPYFRDRKAERETHAA